MSSDRAFVLQKAQAEKSWIVEIRRELHQYPELKFEEFKTSALVRRKLAELGYAEPISMAGTGLVASIGNGKGPCVALRADMDALAIIEDNDLKFKSKVHGKMHACGHDCHTAMLLGAAKILKSLEPGIEGTIKLIFQPAEEGGAGGQKMVLEGALDNPKVDRIFGLHVWPDLPTGQIGSRSGTLLAAISTFRLVVQGEGGHAAYPHKGHDSILAMSHIICAFQSMVSRERDPVSPGVVTVTAIHGGDSFNVFPCEVVAQGTIRALKTDVLAKTRESMQRVASAIASGLNCRATVEFVKDDPDYPATVNSATCWQTARKVGEELIGKENVREIEDPVLGGEDFAFYLEKIKEGCFVGVGIKNEKIGATVFVHKPKFIVDEDALPIGTALHVGFALQSLDELRSS